VPAVVVATQVGRPADMAKTCPFVPLAVTPKVPLPPEVLIKPLVERLERVVMFWEVLTPSAPELFVNPVPAKLLNDWLPILRLVVEAVMNDEYTVEEEYGETTDVPKYPVLGLVAPEAPISYELSVKRRLPVKVPPVRAKFPLAVPVKAAVIVPAEKLPEESLATMAPGVLIDDVATLPKVLTPVKYGMLPMTAADEVESPLNPMTVPVESVMGQVAEMVPCLPLSVVCRSVPLRESVPMYALVDEAVMKDEYMVEEE
jgi:hypothetical protein